jgi:hypothetical protein
MEVERVLSRIRREYPAVDVERGLAVGQAAVFDELVADALDAVASAAEPGREPGSPPVDSTPMIGLEHHGAGPGARRWAA